MKRIVFILLLLILLFPLRFQHQFLSQKDRWQWEHLLQNRLQFLVEIHFSQLGSQAGIIGAAAIALERITSEEK